MGLEGEFGIWVIAQGGFLVNTAGVLCEWSGSIACISWLGPYI